MLYVLWADAEALRLDPPPTISRYRAEKLKSLKDTRASRASLAAELLLIRALRRADPAALLPTEIEEDANGKPFFPDLPYRFSLSHSGRFAACALGDFELGLDIQARVSCRESLVKRFFAPEEQDEVFFSKDPDDAFTRLWCRKESFLKAIGLGLRQELNGFSTAGKNPACRYENVEYAFRETRIGELYLCLCAPSGSLPESVSFEEVELI